MKKIFLYALMLFSGFSCISCSDDEKGMANIDREWMTPVPPTSSSVL